MHIAYPLVEAKESRFPLVLDWETDVKYVDVDHNTICFWQELSEDSTRKYPPFHSKYRYNESIEALCSIKIDGVTCLAVYVGGTIEILSYIPRSKSKRFSESRLRCRLRVVLSEAGLPKISESDPLLVGHEYGKGKRKSLLALHSHPGIITVIDVTGLIEDNQQKQAPRRKQRVFRTNSFAIGNVVVSQIEFMRTKEPQLAVVARDIDFRWMIRWFNVSDLSAFPMVNEAEFIEKPFLTAADRYTMVVAGPRATMYPAFFGNGTEVGRNCVNVESLGFEQSHTFHLDFNYSSREVACSTVIDDTRTLYITTSGDTFVLFLQLAYHSMTVKVGQYQAIDLGKTTTATAVVRLETNRFYASSRTSRSITFTVATEKPYISVKISGGNMNTPPILDIVPEHHANHVSTLMLRGGLHDSEIARHATMFTSLDEEVSMPVHQEVRRIRIVDPFRDEDGSVVQLLPRETPPSYSPTSYSLDTLTEASPPAREPGPDKFVRCPYSWVPETLEVKELGFTLVSPPAIVFDRPGNPRIDLPELDQVSDMLWYGEYDNLIISLVSWNGNLVKIKYKDSTATKYFTHSTPLRGHIVMAEESYEEYVILLTGEGSLYQILTGRMGSGGPSHTVLSELKPTEGTFRMSMGGLELLVYDYKAVYELTLIDDPYLSPVHIKTFDTDLVSCAYNRQRLCVLFEDGTLSSFRKRSSEGNSYSPETFFSSGMFLRAVPIDKEYFVALQLNSDVKSRTATSLVLFRASDYKVCHTLKSGGNCYADICLMDDGDEVSVVALNVIHEPGTPLLQSFIVKNKKLVPQKKARFEGQIPAQFSFVKMTCHKNTVWVTGTSTCRFTFDSSANVWYAFTMKQGSQFHGVDLGVSDEMVVVADSVRGLFVGKPEEQEFRKLRLEYEPSFISAVASFKDSTSFVYGDSKGNIGLVKIDGEICSKNCEQVIAFNVGSPVNVIKIVKEEPLSLVWGTVGGALHKILFHDFSEEQVEMSKTASNKFFEDKSKYHFSEKLEPWIRPDGTKLPVVGAMSGSGLYDVSLDVDAMFLSRTFR